LRIGSTVLCSGAIVTAGDDTPTAGAATSRPAGRDDQPAADQPVAAGGEQAQAFVRRFEQAWREGRQGLRDFEAVTAPNVVLTQPLTPAGRGIADFHAQFDAIFDAMPDLRGEVLAWGATADGVLIDLALRGTLGGRPVELHTCDRIVLRDGVMVERHARMDPLPLIKAVALSPRTALALARARLR
jgi:ketosteroid isomerase-like protein